MQAWLKDAVSFDMLAKGLAVDLVASNLAQADSFPLPFGKAADPGTAGDDALLAAAIFPAFATPVRSRIALRRHPHGSSGVLESDVGDNGSLRISRIRCWDLVRIVEPFRELTAASFGEGPLFFVARPMHHPFAASRGEPVSMELADAAGDRFLLASRVGTSPVRCCRPRRTIAILRSYSTVLPSTSPPASHSVSSGTALRIAPVTHCFFLDDAGKDSRTGPSAEHTLIKAVANGEVMRNTVAAVVSSVTSSCRIDDLGLSLDSQWLRGSSTQPLTTTIDDFSGLYSVRLVQHLEKINIRPIDLLHAVHCRRFVQLHSVPFLRDLLQQSGDITVLSDALKALRKVLFCIGRLLGSARDTCRISHAVLRAQLPFAVRVIRKSTGETTQMRAPKAVVELWRSRGLTSPSLGICCQECGVRHHVGGCGDVCIADLCDTRMIPSELLAIGEGNVEDSRRPMVTVLLSKREAARLDAADAAAAYQPSPEVKWEPGGMLTVNFTNDALLHDGDEELAAAAVVVQESLNRRSSRVPSEVYEDILDIARGHMLRDLPSVDWFEVKRAIRLKVADAQTFLSVVSQHACKGAPSSVREKLIRLCRDAASNDTPLGKELARLERRLRGAQLSLDPTSCCSGEGEPEKAQSKRTRSELQSQRSTLRSKAPADHRSQAMSSTTHLDLLSVRTVEVNPPSNL